MIVLFHSPGRRHAPYSLHATPSRHVPSLSWLCLRRLAPFADQIQLDTPLNYDSNHSDVLEPNSEPLDPRLWAALVQIYDNLPSHLQSISVSLSDPHLPLLQSIAPSPRFGLLTLLDLPDCPHLTDITIVALSSLHSLIALDASATSLSSYAVKSLAGTLCCDDNGTPHRGPWPLRLLRLRYCRNIDDDVYRHLRKFPLLAAVDLRGTRCQPLKDGVFHPCSRGTLFHPSPLSAAIDSLMIPKLFSSQNCFKLVIEALNYPVDPTSVPTLSPQESYVFVPRTDENHMPHSGRSLAPQEAKQEAAGKLRRRGLIPPTYESSRGADLQEGFTHSRSDNFFSESPPELFYSAPPLAMGSKVKYDGVKNYDASMYYHSLDGFPNRPSSPYDSHLTLYRAPPPWSTLDGYCKTLQSYKNHSRKKRFETHLASIDRGQKKYLFDDTRIETLRIGGVTGDLETPVLSHQDKRSTFLQGRNPFRRQSITLERMRPISPRRPLTLDHE